MYVLWFDQSPKTNRSTQYVLVLQPSTGAGQDIEITIFTLIN